MNTDTMWVRRSTGHREYPNRRTEAEFMLQQFGRHYKPRQLTKGKRGRILATVIKNLDNLTPEMLFDLRTVYQRSKKMFNAEGGW